MYLSDDANSSFATQPKPVLALNEFLIDLEAVRSLDAMRAFIAFYSHAEAKFAKDDLAAACTALTAWHINQMESGDDASMHRYLSSLSLSKTAIGCHLLPPTTISPEAREQRRLLVETACDAIRACGDGWEADIVVREFMREMGGQNLRLDIDSCDRILDVMETSCRDADYGYSIYRNDWQGWKHAISYRLTRFELAPSH